MGTWRAALMVLVVGLGLGCDGKSNSDACKDLYRKQHSCGPDSGDGGVDLDKQCPELLNAVGCPLVGYYDCLAKGTMCQAFGDASIAVPTDTCEMAKPAC